MTEFERLYTGRLWSVMGWDQLTAFWQCINPAAGWYLQAGGTSPVPTFADAATVSAFIERIDILLRSDHHESYCGIVYADDLENPRLIKIFDPNNLGSSCGSSKSPTPPGWVMSRVAPDGVLAARPAPENRRRWWRSLLGDS
ncbi:MAG: hypothetical protein K9J74_07885 [Sulfuritalea sp.]|nr:hypothetical protein [Sulfuritalea sp.]